MDTRTLGGRRLRLYGAILYCLSLFAPCAWAADLPSGNATGEPTVRTGRGAPQAVQGGETTTDADAPQAEAAECSGVGWPADFVPDDTPVALPSYRLGDRLPLLFPEMRLPPVDTQTLLDEDEADAAPGRPLRIGVARDVSLTTGDGRWHEIDGGGAVWVAAVASDGAYEMRLHFVNVDLPPGGELVVYSPDDPAAATGPFTGAGPHGTGAFWAGTVAGDVAHIEYYVPDADVGWVKTHGRGKVPFDIDLVGHMYRSPNAAGALRSPLDCMIDVACKSQWRNASYSVAKIVFYDAGLYTCSGTLLASVNEDRTPYFLTGAHCIDSQTVANTVEFRWFYQHSYCDGSFMAIRYSDDAELLGTSGYNGNLIGADWTLLMVRGVLPSAVYWSGWTSSDPSSGSYAVGVHHPSGSWKRWSRGRRYYGSYYFHQIRYNIGEGQIYYGSSGSGMWTESDQKVFGNCSFAYGEAGCDNPNRYIYYGRFSTYYAGISSLLAGGSDDDLEENDSYAEAIPLASGTWSNRIVKSLDEDWYRVTILGGEPFTASLTFTDAWGNIDAKLYDACGQTVVASATTSTSDELLSYTPPAGATADFYLQVYLSDDTRNFYNMTLTVPACGSDLECDDGVACTVDECFPPDCVRTPDDTLCDDDGIFCNGGETCDRDCGCQPSAIPCPGQGCDEGALSCVPPPAMSCLLPGGDAAVAGSTVEVQIKLEDALDLQGYQVTLNPTRTSGTGSLTVPSCPDGIDIDQSRSDYVFFEHLDDSLQMDCGSMQLGATCLESSTDVGSCPRGYLGTFALEVSSDAIVGSTFEVAIRTDASSFLYNSNDLDIPFTNPGPCTLTIVDAVCTPHKFGDVAGQPGARSGCGLCSPQPDLTDVLCVLDGFAGGPNWSAACAGADLLTTSDNCAPNGRVDLADILGVLGAFAGAPPCPGDCPCDP